VAVKAGELELIFLNSHPPESIHSGFPFLPFCRLAIVPDLEPDVCALAIDAILADVIIIAAAAAIMISLLVVKTCLLLCIIKNTIV